jgi:hypothetical protein
MGRASPEKDGGQRDEGVHPSDEPARDDERPAESGAMKPGEAVVEAAGLLTGGDAVRYVPL